MDRDLRLGVKTCIILVVLNIASAIPNLWRHNFTVGCASLIWAANAAVLLLHIRSIQRTRDEIRVVLSLANRIEEEQEHD
jgi:hypothetical protein